MSQPQFQKRPETPFNDFFYDMPKSKNNAPGSNRPGTWHWEIGLNGIAKLKISDGRFDKDDPNGKNKIVDMVSYDRDLLLYTIEQAATDSSFKEATVYIRWPNFNPQTRKANDQASVQATMVVKRTPDGIKVKYSRGADYSIVFDMIHNHSYVETKDESGNNNKNLLFTSCAYSLWFTNFSRRFLDLNEWEKYQRKGKKNNNNNNQNSFGNNNNNNNGGNNNQNSFDEDFDDDF